MKNKILIFLNKNKTILTKILNNKIKMHQKNKILTQKICKCKKKQKIMMLLKRKMKINVSQIKFVKVKMITILFKIMTQLNQFKVKKLLKKEES